MTENFKTVRHAISDNGFHYDMLKGQLKKGSHISKKQHPVPEVEQLKTFLISRKYVKDMGAFYELKKPLSTGVLMARNLVQGDLIAENHSDFPVVVDPVDAKRIKEKLPEGNIGILDPNNDSDYDMNLQILTGQHSYRLDSIYELTINKSFFQNHGSDSFGEDEQFVADILKKIGFLSETIRHGDTNKQEADIVDENQGIQIEVTYEKRLIPINKRKSEAIMYSPSLQTIRLVDNNPFLSIGGSLVGKFVSKEYASNYRLFVAALNIGTRKTASDFLHQLELNLRQTGLRNNVSGLIVISADYLADSIHVISLIGNQAKETTIDGMVFPFVQKAKVLYEKMEDDENYLMLCNNIFKSERMIYYGSKSEIVKLAQELKVFGVT